jgi:hypothetical protein
MAVDVLIAVALLVVVAYITKLDDQVIAQIVMPMMTFVPFFGDLSRLLWPSLTAWTTVVFRLVVVPTSPSIFVLSEETLFSAFAGRVILVLAKFVRIIRTSHSFLIWRGPANSVVALVAVVSLWPIELTFHLVVERRLVHMVLLFFLVLKSAEMSVIQITVSKVWRLLANVKLNTAFGRGTDGVAFLFGIDLVVEDFDPVGVYLITLCIFLQKHYLNFLIRTFFSRLYRIAMHSNIIIFVE